MSELMNTSNCRKNFRWQLLASVSAIALAATFSLPEAKASSNEADRPTVWIELGGQMEALDSGEENFVPSFLLATPRPGPETISPLTVEGSPHHAYGAEGKITIQPENSDWVFSAALRFGRSNASKHIHQQSYPTKGIPLITPPFTSYIAVPTYPRKALQFSDGSRQSSESHTILDFQAGRDVGLGLFGAGSSSVFNLGVRFAQFGSKSKVAFKTDPDAHPTYVYFGGHKIWNIGAIYHFNTAKESAARSFKGVGPSVSWNASAPVLGSPQSGEFKFDWGLNAAVLFGRQKTKAHHQTTAQYHHGKYGGGKTGYIYSPYFRATLSRNAPPDRIGSHSVVVPNVGGFAGLSFNYAEAKLSLGYRADFFFGAMDGGIDKRKSENVGFYGPFATVSVGIGG